MAIVTTKDMFAKAYNGGYAIPALNANNPEIPHGLTPAATEPNAPLTQGQCFLLVAEGVQEQANIPPVLLPAQRPLHFQQALQGKDREAIY